MKMRRFSDKLWVDIDQIESLEMATPIDGNTENMNRFLVRAVMNSRESYILSSPLMHGSAELFIEHLIGEMSS